MRPIVLLALLLPGFPPGVGAAQAVPRTDTPRAGTLRVTFDPVVSAWDNEFTPLPGGRRRIGASLPAAVFVHAERRVTPLTLEFGLTDRIALSARLPLVRTNIRAGHSPDSTADSANAALDSLLADTTYMFAPIGNSRRGLRYFPGDAELQAKIRLGPAAGRYAAAAQVVVRLPTGHLDSPNDLFDLATGDHQTDIEVGAIQELTVAGRLWLNLSVRGTQQRRGTRERRVAPQDSLLVPYAALLRLGWDPGDALALDLAPLYRFNRYFAAGVTVGYFTKRRDHYTFASPADSVALATRLGAPRSASVLDAGTSERRVRLGAAVTYLGPNIEGGLSFEQTVSGAGGRIPVMSVFRIVLRTSRWPF
jgi:hypothetical protein